jgi:hypothetical protein
MAMDFLRGLALLAALAPAAATTLAAEDPFPHAGLTPDEVVRIQLDSLRGNDAADHGIAVCFRFASPGNRSQTGPLPRFISMIKDGPYQLMLTYDEADYEPVEIVDDVARQRVTLSTSTLSVTYAFYLSRQTEGECRGCWMTDAVTIERINTEAA